MVRKLGLLSLLMLVLSLVSYPAVQAQGENPYATYQINVRTGPSGDYGIVVILDAGTPLVLEARNEDISWVLGHTVDGAYRGWVAALYLTYPVGYAAARLPVSAEIVGAAPAAPQGETPAEPAPQGESPAITAPTGGSTAYTTYQINVRSGPSTGYPAIGVVDGGVGLMVEARNGDASWVLAITTDGSLRGWMSTLYVKFVNISATQLPYSQETVGMPEGGASPAGVPSTTGTVYEGIVMGSFEPSTVSGIDLAQIPIVGHATGTARKIYEDGQKIGRDPNVIAKVGDCSTEHWYFLKPFTWGQYDLGEYGALQGVIDRFGASMDYDSQASHNGYNVNSVMDPDWADPSVCQPGESPMDCEYRLHNPSVSIIMFGTSDLLSMSAYEFDFYIRDVVRLTRDKGIIPILSTFPGNQGFPSHTILYNQIVVRVAMDYDIPLINLWRALEALPNEGLELDGFHLDLPPGDTSCYLTGDNLQNGYPMRNLVTMQTLDAVMRGSMY